MSEEAKREFARKLFGSTTAEKRSRDQALFGPMHGLNADPEPKRTATPNFDGGAREPTVPVASFDPSPPPPVYREPGGWYATEIEDGAELLFPFLRGK